MIKPTVIRGIVKAFTGCILVLAYCAMHRVWADNSDSSPQPNTTPAVVSDAATPVPAKEKISKKKAKVQEEAKEEAASQTEDRAVPKYVGTDTCITCHQDNGNSFLHSTHGRLMESRKGVTYDKACETCHGPGSLHVEFADNTTDARFQTIKFPPKMDAPEANAICLTCHVAKTHFHWKGSPHDMQNVTCVSCHMVHQDEKKPNKHLLKAPKVMDVCFTCHIEKKAQIARNGHMPLNEDEMTCTSCHDVHGTSGDKNLLGDSVNETCFKCHADKRGPFLFEHPPVQESCLNCHNPHGSNNDHMLVERPPFLCQRCHMKHGVYDATALANKDSHFIGQACLNCHSNIHGSNSPSGSKFQR